MTYKYTRYDFKPHYHATLTHDGLAAIYTARLHVVKHRLWPHAMTCPQCEVRDWATLVPSEVFHCHECGRVFVTPRFIPQQEGVILDPVTHTADPRHPWPHGWWLVFPSLTAYLALTIEQAHPTITSYQLSRTLQELLP